VKSFVPYDQAKNPVSIFAQSKFVALFFFNELGRRATDYINKKIKPRLGKQQMGKNYRAKPGNWIGASAHAGLNSNKYPVGLGYRPGPQLTLPARIGSLT